MAHIDDTAQRNNTLDPHPLGDGPSSIPLSVIIPTYNRAHLLERAIASVMCQEQTVAEVIIVDDASMDDTKSVVQRWQKKHDNVRYERLPVNRGANYARNRGVQLATNEFVAFQDSDDVWHCDLTRTLWKHSGPSRIVFGSHVLVRPSGEEQVFPSHPISDVRDNLYLQNPISTQTVIVPRSVFPGPPFDPRLKRFQDWDAWLTVARNKEIEFHHISHPIATLYRQSDSISEGSAYIRSRSLLRILVRHLPDYLLRPKAMLRLICRIVLPRITTRGPLRATQKNSPETRTGIGE